MPRKSDARTICFVTGTRAEFGLMQATLRAIQSHPRLSLQLIATGMHLDPAHGKTINQIRKEGWRIDAIVPWKPAGNDLSVLAQQTGRATARLAAAYAKLKPDIVLVVGDRVEAFAGATAAHLSGIVVAHVHGGDRALGQVDDALRHAITKLSHLHFPATRQSAERIAKLGEDKWRIHCVGSPGLDGIVRDALPLPECNVVPGDMPARTGKMPVLRQGARYALLILHPSDSDDSIEHQRAAFLLKAVKSTGFDTVAILYPNNDPGSAGVIRAWQTAIRSSASTIPRLISLRGLPRPAFLGLLRDAAVLVGNSSSGIIEAASFGTPVLDIGPRQAGRERGPNVTTVPFNQSAIRKALARIWNNGRPRRYPKKNLYGAGDTSRRIAQVLASTPLTPELRRKLIAY